MKINIVIVYELYKRESLNVALLKCELEKRGYNVFVLNKYESIFNKKCDVLIIPNSYYTYDYDFYKYRFNNKNSKIINLQVEQIHSKKMEDLNDWVAEGEAKKCYFMCWGENRKKQLLKAGVDNNHIEIVGALHLDTLRERFAEIWKTRQELSCEFKIDASKKWYIYFSSLTYSLKDSAISKETINSLGYDKWKENFDFQYKTHINIIKTIKRILRNKDKIFIYRPHPTESITGDLLNLIKEYEGRFFVIGNYNIKQWIKVCDVVITGLTTSIAELVFAKKKFIVYIPVKTKYEVESYFFDNLNFCSTIDELISSIDEEHYSVMPVENIKRYFDLDIDYSYLRIADFVEKISRREGIIENNYYFHRISYLIKNKAYLKIFIKKVYQFLFKKFGFQIKNETLRRTYFINSWEDSIIEKEDFNIWNAKIRRVIEHM